MLLGSIPACLSSDSYAVAGLETSAYMTMLPLLLFLRVVTQPKMSYPA